jgi:hypothetical protein
MCRRRAVMEIAADDKCRLNAISFVIPGGSDGENDTFSISNIKMIKEPAPV